MPTDPSPMSDWPIARWVEKNELAMLPPSDGSGRVLITATEGEGIPEKGEVLANIGYADNFLPALGPEDVLWVPLYQAIKDGCLVPWPDTIRLPDYEAHLDLIRWAAPKVKAIMLGNVNSEFSWTFGHPPEMAYEFVRDNAKLVADLGGRVAFGTVTWDLMVDCYGVPAAGAPDWRTRPGRLAEVMREVNALQICYCGFAMTDDTTWDRTTRVLPDFLPWLDAREPRPHERLRDYLGGLDIWSDLNKDAGNAGGVKALGFSGGVL